MHVLPFDLRTFFTNIVLLRWRSKHSEDFINTVLTVQVKMQRACFTEELTLLDSSWY